MQLPRLKKPAFFTNFRILQPFLLLIYYAAVYYENIHLMQNIYFSENFAFEAILTKNTSIALRL
jgi:hypothetical protein